MIYREAFQCLWLDNKDLGQARCTCVVMFSTVIHLFIFYRLLSISFAVGIDLNKSNIDRLKRKFRLNEESDVRLFQLIKDHKQKNLKLQSALAIRKQLIKSGHNNIVSALNAAQFPPFLHEIVSLDWW